MSLSQLDELCTDHFNLVEFLQEHGVRSNFGMVATPLQPGQYK
jgi:hypothetical protein